MNLSQVKSDRDSGVMICRDTWDKVLEAALLMAVALDEIRTSEHEYVANLADDALSMVEKL